MAAKTWSLTTPADDALVDSIPNLVRDVKKHIQIAAGFYSEAQSTPDQTIAIYAGIVFFGTTKVEYVGLDVVDLGTAGAFEVSALTADYYNKVLFTIDSGGTLAATEGTEHAVAASVVAPAIPTGKFPVCMVTVQDDGNAGAGSILTIEQSEIQQLQSFAQKTGQAGTFCPDYNETDQGLTGNGKSAKAYIDTISTNSATLIFRHSSGGVTTTYTFGTSETIPSNINVIVEKGAVLSIATAQTFTINGPFEAGLYQVFSGAGSVVFGAGSVEGVYVEWRGVTPDNVDSTTAMKSLLIDIKASTVKTMLFGVGTYSFNDELDIYSGMIIKGLNEYQTSRHGTEAIGKEQTRINFVPTSEKTLFHTNKEGEEIYCAMISISGIYINGNSLGAVTNSKYAIHANNLAKSTFINIGIEHFQIGVYNAHTMTNMWKNCYFNKMLDTCVQYNAQTNTSDVWEGCSFRESPWAIIIQHGIGIRCISCLFESLTTGGINVYRECDKVDFVTCYGEDTPSTDAGNNYGMFYIAHDGTAGSPQVSIFGGIYAGNNGGGYHGSFVDANHLSHATSGKVSILGADFRRFTNGIKVNATNTNTNSVFVSSISYAEVTNLYVNNAISVNGRYRIYGFLDNISGGINSVSLSGKSGTVNTLDLSDSGGDGNASLTGRGSTLTDNASHTTPEFAAGSAVILLITMNDGSTIHETGIFSISRVGANASIVKLVGTANTSNVEIDGKLCCFPYGASARIKNMLGATVNLKVLIIK